MLRRLLRSFFPNRFPDGSVPSRQALERIHRLRDRPLPPELAVATPRPDVWGRRGHLHSEHSQLRYKPLLTHGFATWGLVFHYESSGDEDERDIIAHYGWLDAEGAPQVRELKERYVPFDAAYNSSHGSIVVSVSARLFRRAGPPGRACPYRGHAQRVDLREDPGPES